MCVCLRDIVLVMPLIHFPLKGYEQNHSTNTCINIFAVRFYLVCVYFFAGLSPASVIQTKAVSSRFFTNKIFLFLTR